MHIAQVGVCIWLCVQSFVLEVQCCQDRQGHLAILSVWLVCCADVGTGLTDLLLTRCDTVLLGQCWQVHA